MNWLAFDAGKLEAELRDLPLELRSAWALLVAERLYPALHAYSRETGGEEALRVRRCLNEVWDHLERGAVEPGRLRAIADELLDSRPETEGNPSALSSYALDAAAAAWEAAQAALTGNAAHAAAAAQIAFDSVWLYSEERENFQPQNVADRKAILVREPVVTELETQRAQLRRARALSTDPKAGVVALRREFGYPKKSMHGFY